MPKISLRSGNITSFEGDAIIIPSDTELTNKRSNKIVQKVLLGNNDLLKELSSIGYCEIGNAVITQGYNLKAKHLIFIPYFDNNNENNKINFVLLHQAFRSAFNLASLYKIRTIAVPIIHLEIRNNSFIERLMNLELFDLFSERQKSNGLKDNEFEDIILGVASEFENTSVKEVFLFR